MTDEELWLEAKAYLPHQESVYEAYQTLMDMGTKMIYYPFRRRIELYNMTLGGDFYEEFKPDEYEYFLDYGWKKGTHWMARKNYKRRLALLQTRLKMEQYQGDDAQSKIKHDITQLENKINKLWQ